MNRNGLVLLVASLVLSLAGQASAQIVLPNIQLGRPGQLNKEQIEQLRKAIEQAGVQGNRPNIGGGGILWGGLRLAKVDAKLQEQLGLPENEGLLVVGVDAKSLADKAGVKASDVLVKINNKAVPNTLDGFMKLVKDQKADEAVDIVAVRMGKEETIKAAKMPAIVQGSGGGGGVPFARPGIAVFQFPNINVNPGLPVNPFGKVDELELKMKVNGATIVKTQKGNDFSGEYAKDQVKITVTGKIENGLPRATEIVVVQGKDERKYVNLRDVPPQQQIIVNQLMPSPVINMMMSPLIQNLQGLPNFPGLPVIPRIDD